MNFSFIKYTPFFLSDFGSAGGAAISFWFHAAVSVFFSVTPPPPHFVYINDLSVCVWWAERQHNHIGTKAHSQLHFCAADWGHTFKSSRHQNCSCVVDEYNAFVNCGDKRNPPSLDFKWIHTHTYYKKIAQIQRHSHTICIKCYRSWIVLRFFTTAQNTNNYYRNAEYYKYHEII